MFSKLLNAALFTAAIAFVRVHAETHTVSFVNKCVDGTPWLWGPNGALYTSTGASITFDGEAPGLISYLQTGSCGNNGEGCTLIEASLINGASSADISLIPPHEFSVTSGFGYYGGCEPAGADCTYAQCPDAFHTSGMTGVQVDCIADNVDLSITFCD
ncbi:glycopeptide [Rhodofomes roseus]|uniref:Glycopeptide n=1 Tax=Rhodofomes roseus TaxID=34475 RepID=A0ABQ8K1E2_9APHY|nr:glycopeptide [Rhodofomes roseus]KAH9830058.1 glycopeptide [Rhodofomes roseus]